MENKKHTPLASLVLVILAMFLAGCTNYFAQRLVQAPNRRGLFKWSMQGHEVKSYDLNYWGIDRAFEIKSGSPEATLSVWVIEPKNEWIIQSGNNWYELFGESFDKLENKDPNFITPEAMIWSKVPKDPNMMDGFSFEGVTDPNVIKNNGSVEAKGTAICLHGLGMDKRIFAWTWGPVLASYGYRAVLVDLRGHGKSGGEYITYGAAESGDVSKVIDYLEKENLVQGKLLLMGSSYGAAIAIQTAAVDERIDAVIALEPYTSLREAAPNFAKKQFGLLALLVGNEYIDEVIDEAGNIAGFDPDENTPIKAIAKCDTPVLLIHGRKDEHIPYRHSEKLHNAAKEHSKLVIMEDQNHLTLGAYNIYRLRDEIIKWLEDN